MEESGGGALVPRRAASIGDAEDVVPFASKERSLNIAVESLRGRVERLRQQVAAGCSSPQHSGPSPPAIAIDVAKTIEVKELKNRKELLLQQWKAQMRANQDQLSSSAAEQKISRLESLVASRTDLIEKRRETVIAQRFEALKHNCLINISKQERLAEIKDSVERLAKERRQAASQRQHEADGRAQSARNRRHNRQQHVEELTYHYKREIDRLRNEERKLQSMLESQERIVPSRPPERVRNGTSSSQHVRPSSSRPQRASDRYDYF